MADLQTQKVTVPAVDWSNKKATLLSLIAGITALGTGHNGLTDAVESELNGLQNQINTLNSATDVDLEAINTALTAINNLMSESPDGANVLALLDKVADELNARDIVRVQNVDFLSATGDMIVDLTSFGFVSITDYEFMVKAETESRLSVESIKVDNASAKVIVRDRECWDFDEHDKYDASGVDASVPLVLTVISQPETISKTVVEADGDSKVIGAE